MGMKTRSWLFRFGISTSSFFFVLANFGAFAQEDEEAAVAAPDAIEEVIVTGSHLKASPEDAPLPVTSVARDELNLEGSPSTLDLIKNLSFSQGADGETDQFQAGSGADRATVNMRGLGPSRSLVLINGARTTWSPHAIGAQAQLLVDVNILPSVALERIDFLRDGAAATYGSDAIAGVMNYITRSDFVGFEVSGSHKMIDGSDGDSEIGLIWGSDQLGNNLHVVSSFSYINRSKLPLVARDWAVVDYADSPRGGWSSVGRPAVFVPYNVFDLTPGGFTGLLIAGTVDPQCNELGGQVTTAGIAGNTLGGFCRFQYTAFDNLSEDGERWQWFTELNTDLNDTTQLAASLLVTDSKVPGWNTSPSYPPNRLVDRARAVRANNPGLIDMARQFANDPDFGPRYTPYAACDESYCGYEGDEWDKVAWVYGRFYGPDGPLRVHKRENDLTRLTVDLTGQLDALDWKLSAGYSASYRISLGGDTMVYRDKRGLEGLAGHECEAAVPNEYNDAGELEFSRETLEQHAGKGNCRYWIPFSNGMHGSHEQVRNGIASNPTFNTALDNRLIHDYMMTGLGGEGDTSLFYLEGTLSGTLSTEMFPELNYAIGAQWRSETYESGVLSGGLNDGLEYPCIQGPEIKDCATGRTGLFGFLPPGFPIDQDRNIQSVFGELNLPAGNDVDINFSMRLENYGGDTGQSIDPKIALRWQITEFLGLRSSVGTTFRGPTLNQTVPENSSNSLQYVGVTGAFKRIDTLGNPGLEPETANTINLGLIFDADIGIAGTMFGTIDYWSYDFQKPLVTEPFNDVLALACPSGAAGPCDPNSPYFDRIVFGGNAVATDVEIININIVNGPDITTDGIDVGGRVSVEAFADSMVTFGTNFTRILSYDVGSWELGEGFDALGRLNYSTSLARSLVELKGRVFVNYSQGPINVRWTANYTDDYVHGAPGNANAPIDSLMTHDLNITWTSPDQNLQFNAGVINLNDEDPPFVTREMNYDAFTHNPFGRMIRVGARYSM